MTKSFPFVDELETLVRARYPALYIVTGEEARAVDAVREIARRRGKPWFEWSSTTGLQPGGTSIQIARNRNALTRDPMVALDQVIDQAEPAIFLFKDFHIPLRRGREEVVRKVKEIALHLKHSSKTLIFTAPVQDVPVEIEKEITVVTLPPPDAAELGHMLDGVLEQLGNRGDVAVEVTPEVRAEYLRAMAGLTLAEAENALARILVEHERLGLEHVPLIIAEKQQVIRKSGLLEFYPAVEGLEEVGGLASLKEWLGKRARAFTPEARAFGLPAPRGVLLLGVQGCGKSLCAKAVANVFRVPLLRFDIGRLFSGLVGSSEENTRKAIALAESIAPCVLWVDEIDKAFAGLNSSGQGDGGVGARVLGSFLTWLSEKQSPVFVAATANDIEALPPELLRKGRLDEVFFVDLPDEGESVEILEIHLAAKGRDPALFDLDLLARECAGFSGAEIAEAINSALHDCFDEGRELDTASIVMAFEATVPLSKTMSEKIEALRVWASERARGAAAD